MLVKLAMPEISGDDAAQRMWWQRLGFFKPKRLMQFGKFINTGEIGYNLCLQQRQGDQDFMEKDDYGLHFVSVYNPIIYKGFCKHQFGVEKSAHQARYNSAF